MLLALAACNVTPATSVATFCEDDASQPVDALVQEPDASPVDDGCEHPQTLLEWARWRAARLAAALLDDRSHFFTFATNPTLDETVPQGRTWYAFQLYHTYLNEPQVFAELYAGPLYDRSATLRLLDVGQALPLPAGTRIRSLKLQNGAYIYYSDPEEVYAIDPRYTCNPELLLLTRREALAQLPIKQAFIQVVSGGDNGTTITIPLATTSQRLMLETAAVQNMAWALLNGMNSIPEEDNDDIQRFAWKVTMPFRLNGAIPSGAAGIIRITPTSPGAPSTMTAKAGDRLGRSPTDPGYTDSKGVAEFTYRELPPDF